jgi:hypothetical protein
MGARLRWASLAVVLALAAPVLAADEKNVDPAKVAGDKKEAADKLRTAGDVTGKLVQWEPNGQYFTLEVEIYYRVPNVGEANALARNQAELARVQATVRDPRERQRRTFEIQRQIVYHQARLFSVKRETTRLEFQAGDGLKVRLNNPPIAVDEKGNPKKYTARELKELKGSDPSLPGYMGELADIHPNVYVKAFLAKTKPGKKKPDELEEQRLPCVMLLILGEPPTLPGR